MNTTTRNPSSSLRDLTKGLTIESPAHRNLRTRRAVTVSVALIAAVSLWALAALVGIELAADTGGVVQHVGLVQVVVASIVAGCGAWAVRAILDKTMKRPRRWWLAVSIAVGVLSLMGPLAAVSAGAMAVLFAFHVVVGGILIVGLAPDRKVVNE